MYGILLVFFLKNYIGSLPKKNFLPQDMCGAHECSVKDGTPGICKTWLGTVFATTSNAPITKLLKCHVLVTSISKTLYLLSFSKILSGITGITRHRHIDEKASFIIMIFCNYVWSICLICSVSMEVEIP